MKTNIVIRNKKGLSDNHHFKTLAQAREFLTSHGTHILKHEMSFEKLLEFCSMVEKKETKHER